MRLRNWEPAKNLGEGGKHRLRPGDAMKGPSLKAYTELKEKGELSDRQEEVLKALHEYSPCTARELGDMAFYKKTVNYYRPRLTELKEMGLVKEKEKRECQISGKTAYTLELTEKGQKVLNQ